MPDRHEGVAANPHGGTSVPAGTCVTHGYHGCVTCPTCSSSAIPPARIAPAATARDAASTQELFDPEEKLTEDDVLDRLRARYSTRNGNGPRWAFATHVRDRAGFDATRTLDAVAMDTWPSSGLALHGFEIKVSRSDWRRELAQPEKAAVFVRFMDYFWVVAPRHVVRADELPDGWGLIETRKSVGLGVAVQAKRLAPEPLDRSFTACLMRAAVSRG